MTTDARERARDDIHALLPDGWQVARPTQDPGRLAWTVEARSRKPVGPSPWGSETRIRSCGEAVVLVDESTEQIPPANILRADLDRLPGRCERWSEAEGAMGPAAVVVLGVLSGGFDRDAAAPG